MKEQEKIPTKYEIFIAIGTIVIIFPAVWLTMSIASYLEIDLNRMSFFLAYRLLLLISLSIIIFPLAIFGEFLNKEWKRFLWRSVLVGVGIAGVFVLVTFSLLTVFDALFPELNLIWQIPLAVAGSSIGLITIAMMIRNSRFKQFAKSNLGW